MLLITINVVGWAVRSWFVSPPLIDMPNDRIAKILEHESARNRIGGALWAVLGAVAFVLLLWALYVYWNGWLLGAAIILAAARLPDLIWEIRSDSRVTPANAPKGVFYRGAAALYWLALPFVWYGMKVSASQQ